MIRPSSRASIVAAALGGLVACAPQAWSPRDQLGGDEAGRMPRIGVARVTLAAEFEGRERDPSIQYDEAATHVGHYLSEALLERGFDVVPPHDSEGTLATRPRSPGLHGDASALARLAAERLGVDALLVVELTRWAPHRADSPPRPPPDPEPLGPPPLLADPKDGSGSPPSPAAVGFRATLHGGPNGRLLWSGEFSETRVTFLENPWGSLRYPGLGMRPLSVTELARWGARRLVDEIPPVSVVPGKRIRRRRAAAPLP